MSKPIPTTEGGKGLQQRLVFHYSRIADWLATRSWYRDENVVQTIRSLILGEPSRVLELCCGGGLLLDRLSALLPQSSFTGVDISPKMVHLARERVAGRKNVQVLNEDWIYGFPFREAPVVDVIIVKNALHILTDLETKLRDLKRFCHSWTTLIVVETVSPSSESNDFIRRLFQIIDPEHLKQKFFTEKTLQSVLDASGWSSVIDRPRYLRQHIETEDWLHAKCSDPIRLERAKSFINNTRNQRIRTALDFDGTPGKITSRMLRLQYVTRLLPHSSIQRELGSHDEELAQLQLL
jgi:ubiquinone/menaquinone biosynthesis C-methylase UbiE